MKFGSIVMPVRLCHDEYGAIGGETVMIAAAREGNLEIVRLCHDEYGATGVETVMVATAREGNLEIVNYRLENSNS